MHYRRLIEDREEMRKWLNRECGNNKKKYLMVIRTVRREAEEKRLELKEKYNE